MTLRTVWRLIRILFIFWRCYTLAKTTMNAVKGVGLGVLAGAAVAAIGTKAMNSGGKTARQVKKSAGKAIHTVGSLLTDVEKMMK